MSFPLAMEIFKGKFYTGIYTCVSLVLVEPMKANDKKEKHVLSLNLMGKMGS